ncbi:helix-turn-helix transcriptional regulator [Priestia aryabhattai]|uniref:helix-turn-helix domain-containing protein n=1 Tax=Priestia aryabhattai TaxID=412384 RepID=UPI002E1F8AF4|nr:helix-turn-helix transcriptional regulator [Priestia aryabhattai]
MKEFKLRGKVVRMARILKSIKGRELADRTGISYRYLSKIELEERSVSVRNEFKLIREFRELGISEAELLALTLIVNYQKSEVQ